MGGHTYKGGNFWACFTAMLINQWHSARFITFKDLQKHNKAVSTENPVLIRNGERGIRLTHMTWITVLTQMPEILGPAIRKVEEAVDDNLWICATCGSEAKEALGTTSTASSPDA